MVETEARLGARPGLTRMSERRSLSSMVISRAARWSSGSMSEYFQTKGTALAVAISCLISS